jgi:integrase/recombinase XerD
LSSTLPPGGVFFLVMRVDSSRAPGAFAEGIEAFLGFISLERGLSAHTVAGYRRDLDQAAAFFNRVGITGWAGVTPDLAAAWVQSLADEKYRMTSQGRKLSALRMLARHLVRERVREARGITLQPEVKRLGFGPGGQWDLP